jgi:hypothetical protein
MTADCVDRARERAGVSSYEGRLELTWTNKPLRLLASEDGSYEWVLPAHYRVAEVRLLDDVATIGDIGDQNVEATTGIEPVYAVLQTAPWTTRARRLVSSRWLPREDSNLGSRIQSPLSYH